MSKDKIHMPSTQGGLVRYFEDEEKGKFILKPLHVVIFAAVVGAIIIVLHAVASSWFGL